MSWILRIMTQSEVNETEEREFTENMNIDRIIEENLLTMCCDNDNVDKNEEKKEEDVDENTSK